MKLTLNILRNNYLLLLIILIAGFFRLYRLGNIPPGPSLDEVTIGWNAYSVMKTGADEYGTRFPLLLRAYDDWRPALYAYLVIPFIRIFNLTAVGVRLPSVILGIGTVILAYISGGEVARFFGYKKGNYPRAVGLISAALTAISPWQIYISRLGHEANLGLFLTAAGTCLLLINLRTKTFRWAVLSGACYIASMYSYQSQKVIVPLIMFAAAIIFLRHWMLYGRKILLLIILMVMSLIPLVQLTFSGTGLIRLSGTSAFNPDQLVYQHSLIHYQEARISGNLPERIYFSRRGTDIRIFLANYLSHFSPAWLFAGGMDESHKVPGMGLLYFWEAPFLIAGIVKLFLMKDRQSKLLLLVLFFVNPLPAAITTQAPHAMRSYTFIPVIQCLSTIGIVYIYGFLKTGLLKKVIPLFLFVLVAVGIRQLWFGYYQIFPVLHSKSFQYSMGDTVRFVSANESVYDRIVFSNNGNLSQSYMFFLFYTRFDPLLYQQYGGTRSGGYAEPHYFSKFEFRPVKWESEPAGKKTLYLVNISEIGEGARIIDGFLNPDGSGTILAAVKER